MDDVSNSASFAIGSSQYLELNEEFHIGGLNYKYGKRVANKGSRSSDVSFRGCVRNVRINTDTIGFPNMKVTQGLTVDCVWRYPCIERTPCIISGICQQFGIDEFICHCNQAYCIRADYTDKYKIFSRLDVPIDIEILSVSPMQILEGDSVFISPLFIDVLFDYTKLGIIEAGVIFHIVQPPKHGRITIAPFGMDKSNETQTKFFSLIDLSTDKVKYTHNGGEHIHDSIVMDMQLVSTSRESMPDYLQGRHRFVLHANITPVNDAPLLVIPPNKVLRLTQGISKILTPDLFRAIDPDSSENTLMYTISGPATQPNIGRLEVSGKPVNTFSQSDINQALVTYAIDSQSDRDDTMFEVAVQVSDGMETSSPVILTINVLPLQLRMINNTGLILVHKSYSLITPSNLSFVSNSEDDQIDVKFTIVQPPQFGSIQRLRTVDSSWITVDSFTSNQMLLGQIRFLHTIELPLHDEFKFTVSLGPVTTIKYDFRITFTKLKIGLQKQIDMVIADGNEEVVINNDHLYHQTMPVPTFSRNVIYIVVKPPKYGVIFVDGYPEYAKEMDSFTQQDIDRNLIRYRTYLKSYSSFVDVFEFLVSAPECEDITGRINIIYDPPEALSRTLYYQTREKIFVNEGRAALVTQNHFEVIFDQFKDLTFNVTQSPTHGALCNYDEKNAKINIIPSFTFDDLINGAVYYCHDDSESNKDIFIVLVVSDVPTNFQFVTQIEVDIKLVNDNEPYNNNEKVFYVVKDDNKILSGYDLQYLDYDLNTTPDKIIYSHVEVPNGQILKNGNPVPLFTQEDLNLRTLLFKHNGADYGKISFIVSDGVFEVTGILEVQASEPFLKVRESNASVVQEGKYIHINGNDLAIDTNLNAEPDEIDYRILDGPHYGALRIQSSWNPSNSSIMIPRNGTNPSTKNFTQLDVNNQKIIYWNTDVASMDKIRYRVTTKGIWTEGELLIRIYPAAYWDLLQIYRNQTLYVEESTSVIISRDILEIIHPKISPGDITYLVTTSPQHGYLEIQSITLDDEYNSKVFDQSTINAEKMFYIQAGVNQSSDYFIFDVTNGITWLRDLMLKIIIIPEHLYIQTRVVYCKEGDIVTITSSDMMPFSEYYYNKILEYKIVKNAQFGHIKSGKSSKVNRFTQKQLEGGLIQYYHNGSENSSDIIKIVAISRNKESIPFDLHISIVAVNDEVPLVVTNTGLQMWIGGKSLIKASDLMAQDYDSPAENLTFVIENIAGGKLMIGENDHQVVNFTQNDINLNQLFFVHNNTFLNGQIGFYVTDGLHNTTRQVLHITVNPISLIAVKNENLHVFPLTRKQITVDQLNYKCSDELRPVRYVITIPPQMGRVLFEYASDGLSSEVSEFTQADINQGKILYEHTHTMVELKSNDSFYFDVISTHASSLIDQVFSIDISVSSGGLLRFLPVPQVILDEGEIAPIKLDLSKVLEYLETRAGIQSPELFIEAYSPSHGTIELMDFKNNVTRLTLNDFNSNRVYYKHDHSDTTDDKLMMSVYLLQGQIFLCNLTIPIKITPINDQPFQLLTQSPSVSVVEGENKTITTENLLTNDLDTSPKDLVYDVISGPTIGKLVKIDDTGMAQDIITHGNQFSQLDIDENRVVYVHYGAAQSTTFYFKVSDGEFKPAYEIFNINVLPITISAGFQNDPILVPQGQNNALIESRHLFIETNVHKTRLMYNITSTPQGGMILRSEKPVLRFSQMQLIDHEVSYLQTDSNRSNDTLQVTAYISDTNYGGVITVKVIVHPCITINPITVVSGERIRLGTTANHFTSTNLNLGRYNPKITIISKPKHGRLKKITRTSGELESSKDKDISTFTYKELKSGVVYFVAKKLPSDVPTLNDSFDYLLTIKSVQPAQGTATIAIQSREMMTDGVILADSHLPFNYMLIIAIVVIVVLFAIFLLMLIRCYMNRVAKKQQDKHSSYPPSLPRPPDFMISNRINSSSDLDSIPVTGNSTPLPGMSNVPQCKVIPVIGYDNDFQDSESEIVDCLNNAHIENYPYGSNNLDPEDWSSSYDINNDVNYASITQSQAAQPQQQSNQQTLGSRTNPLLRRNQYWV